MVDTRNFLPPRKQPTVAPTREVVDHSLNFEARGNGPEFYQEPKERGTSIDTDALQQLEALIRKVPLDEVAKLVVKLTYGEMMEFVHGIKAADTGNVLPDELKLEVIIHKWAVSREEVPK